MQVTERPRLTVSQAVESFAVSRATLNRRLAAREIIGAEKDAGGRWKIPVESLQAAGIAARKTYLTEISHNGIDKARDKDHPLGTPENGASSTISDGAHEISQLRIELAHERAQRERAEAIADERKERITDLQRALAMIEAAVPPTVQTLKPRRRWWQRTQ